MKNLIYFRLILFFVCLPFLCFSQHYQLSVCAIFQNEAPYLKEWIDFHIERGVQHFYLYNHCSTDNYKHVLKPYIKKNIVELIDWSIPYESLDQWNHIQCSAYNHAINKSRHHSKWLAVIDTDEFLFCINENNINTFLKNFEAAVGLCANWQMYGTSNISKIPTGEKITKHLVYRAKTDNPANIHIKSIVRPEYVQSFTNPHNANYLPGLYQVNENGQCFSGPWSPYISVNNIRINHYWTKDEYYLYYHKLPQRSKWPGSVESFLQQANEMNEVYDPISNYNIQ
jgi:hypothetical protein